MPVIGSMDWRKHPGRGNDIAFAIFARNRVRADHSVARDALCASPAPHRRHNRCRHASADCCPELARDALRHIFLHREIDDILGFDDVPSDRPHAAEGVGEAKLDAALAEKPAILRLPRPDFTTAMNCW